MSQTNKKVLSENNQPPPPPDGGWGWMVVFGSFMIHINTHGVCFSVGVFLMALLDHFEDAGHADVAWIGSILYGTLQLVGPLAGILITTIGFQSVIFAGSIVACVGFLLSIWATNIYFLYFSIGILGGLGLGLIYVPAAVFLPTYFKSKISLATGIASSGSGIGTIIYAPLSQLLLDTYGWRGAILIVGGIILHCIPAGLLFRPLTKPTTTLKSVKPTQISMLTNTDICNTLNSSPSSTEDPDLSAKGILNICERRHSLIPVLPDYTVKYLKEGIASTEGCVSTITVSDRYSDDFSNSKDNTIISKRRRSLSLSSVEDIKKFQMMNEKAQESNLVHTSSLDDLSVCNRNLYADWVFSFRARPEVHLSEEEILSSSTCVVFCRKYDLIVFKEVLFDVYAFACFLLCFAYFAPFMFLPDRANKMGISTSFSSSLVLITGVSSTFGRLLCGFISDYKCINKLVLFSTAMTTGGIVTIGSLFAHELWGLAVYAVTYGFAIGSVWVLLPLVTADFVGVNKLTNAYGFIMLFCGMATFIGPPVAGWLYDYTESYTKVFVMVGVLLIASGVLLYCVAFIKRCKEKQNIHPSVSDVNLQQPVTKC